MAAKYVKLGKKAKGGSFFEANNQVSVYGDKVQKIGARAFAHARINKAINAGHLVLTDEAAYKEWCASNPKAVKKADEVFAGQNKPKNKKKAEAVETGDEDEDEDEDEEEVDYMSLNKDPLIAYALTLDKMEFSEEELNDMNKSEIQAEIQEALEDAEDED